MREKGQLGTPIPKPEQTEGEHMLRIRLIVLAVLIVGTAMATAFAKPAAPAFATPTPPGFAKSPSHRSPHHGPRRGGHVVRAWPDRGHRRPSTRLARWLAREVGAKRPRTCARNWRKARHRCRLHVVHSRRAILTLPLAAGDPGSPAGDAISVSAASSAGASALADPTASQVRALATSTTTTLPLNLVRSYQIPPDDPAYSSLLNWSWSYDSAVSAAAFVVTGNQANAQQLLDQLSALQHTDGSIEVAFNTATGQAASVFRAGTIAWVGLAGAMYDSSFSSGRYLNMEQLAAGYLISLQGSNGLIRGGPDVSWVSTEHNLAAYAFLSRLGNELNSNGDPTNAATYLSAAARIASGIDSNLIARNGGSSYFLEGLSDPARALDVQALGASYLQSRGDTALAGQVLANAESIYAVDGQSITLSSDPSTYNKTYAAVGPFSGFAPYAGVGAPNVIWPEGTAELRLAAATLGQPTAGLDQQLKQFASVTSSAGGAVLQADATVTNGAYGVTYHVWPAAAAAAWQLLAQQLPTTALFPYVGTYAATVLADSPQIFYRLNETSGTTAFDSSGNAYSGVYQGGVTLGVPGATSGGATAVTLNGTSGYVSSSTLWTNPTVFTNEAWFKTTTATGGVIIGFGNTAVGPPANFDRMIYMSASGQLYFGIALNQTIHSTNSYNDGNWHLAEATVSSAGASLYVDGQLAATNPKLTAPQTYNGYWRVGDESTGGWTAHANNYFTGTVADAAVYPTALGARRIAAHYVAGR